MTLDHKDKQIKLLLLELFRIYYIIQEIVRFLGLHNE